MLVLVPTELKTAVSVLVGSDCEPGPVVLVAGFQLAGVPHRDADVAAQV
jgi:hypothetical protein